MYTFLINPFEHYGERVLTDYDYQSQLFPSLSCRIISV